MVIFEVFWTKSRVLGQIGRSGRVLGFISSNFGPNPTAGRPPKGNNRGAIIIIVIPVILSRAKSSNRRTDRQSDRQTDGQTDGPTDRILARLD